MKLQGFIVESASKPVEALGPPACPGANCPMAFLIKPGSASPNNEALNHPVDSLRGLPVSASITSSTRRSEEHTSELQSLMRISYAVFCLKKKQYTSRNYIPRTM